MSRQDARLARERAADEQAQRIISAAIARVQRDPDDEDTNEAED